MGAAEEETRRRSRYGAGLHGRRKKKQIRRWAAREKTTKKQIRRWAGQKKKQIRRRAGRQQKKK